MAYTGKKPADFIDLTQSQNLEVTGELEVDTIKDTGGTTAIEIDSSGRVTLPAVPAFRIGLTANISVTSTSLTTITFNETTTDNHFLQGFTLSSGVITVPVSGVYMFGGQVRIDNLNTGYVELRFYINNSASGNNFSYVINGDPATNYQSLTFGTVLNLSANDDVRLYTFTNADDAYNIMTTGTELHGHLVG